MDKKNLEKLKREINSFFDNCVNAVNSDRKMALENFGIADEIQKKIVKNKRKVSKKAVKKSKKQSK